MDFADLVAPLSPERFLADYWGRKPVHIPAAAGRARPGMLTWDRFNAVLQQRLHWDADHLKLVMNGRGVAGEHFLDPVPGVEDGRRFANLAKVEAFLAMGASLLATEIQDAAPEIRRLTDTLGLRFAGRSWGNAYASFQGVQAFGTHFDTHEVFAVHGEGEKRWRLYTNRAENPTEVPEGDGAQAMIEQAKGPVTMDVVLRPGDVLYIPRGWFHDAVASAEASLHLTIGILPPTGQLVLELLQKAASDDPAFRAYLADARDGDALAGQLAQLGGRLAVMLAAPAFRDAVAVEQARSADPGHPLSLPARPTLHFYARTQVPHTIEPRPTGAVLRTPHGEHRLGRLREVAEYMLTRPAVSLEELVARSLHLDREEIAGLVAAAERLGLLQPYTPEMG